MALLGLLAALLAPAWLYAQDPEAGAVSEGVAATANPASGNKAVYLPMVASKVLALPPLFGAQMNRVNEKNGMAQAVDAGAYWVRFSAFRWDKIEPVRTQPFSYQWSVVDEASLINAETNGLEVIAVVHNTPPWAQKYPGSFCSPIREDALGEFAQFLTALVRRYSAPPYNVHYWELWNEPDTPLWIEDIGFGCWGDESDPYYGGGYFAEMLKRAYPAIKAADPQAQVLLPGLLLDCDPNNPPPGKNCKASHFLEGILPNDGGRFFDIANMHTYTWYAGGPQPVQNANWPGSVTSVPEKTAFLRSALNRYGWGDKPLLNTELALACAAATNECFEMQAMHIPRVYAEALALSLKGQVYYPMISDWYNTGLVQPNLTPKPAYRAFATASSFLGSARYQGEATGYGPQVEGYTFSRRGPNGHLDVVWATDNRVWTVPLPAGALTYNRYGERIASAGVIQIGYSPVYVVRP